LIKLLFDQNISYRIIKKICNYYPESKQIRELKLENSSDIQIWMYSKKNNFVIVTFDADFYEFSNLYGFPPKIIWLKTGNSTTNYLSELLIQKQEVIIDFINNQEIACLELNDTKQ